MSTKKENHTFYNFQFKHTAVRITNHPEIQTNHVAEALDIHPIMLYRWRQEMREGRIEDNDAEARSINKLTAAEKKIKTLEKELKRLRAENSILKKAERLFPGKK
jgi:transposase-like protein